MTKSLKPVENSRNEIMGKPYNCPDVSIDKKDAIYTLVFFNDPAHKFMLPGSILITFMTVSLSITN